MKEKEQLTACRRKTSIGGQALMEGVMMRGPKMTAMAVRNTKGEIVVEEFETKGTKRPAICRLPIIRGLFGYIDSMTLGYKCLMRSAELSGLEDLVEENPKKKKKRLEAEANEKILPTDSVNDALHKTETEVDEALGDAKSEEKKEEKIPSWAMTAIMVVSVVFGLGLALFLFKWLPTQIFAWLTIPFPVLQNMGNDAVNSLVKSAFEGVLKIILLVGYMGAISLMSDIRRTFMYHGAEHKTIFCYEAGLELTVENVKKQRRFHPRCGTSFLILMLLVNIFVSFFIDPVTLLIWNTTLGVWGRTLVSLALLPLIVGLGYELIKLAGRHENWLTRLISAPGVWLQHITVFEPTDDMIECAITSLNRVIPNDESDAW